VVRRSDLEKEKARNSKKKNGAVPLFSWGEKDSENFEKRKKKMERGKEKSNPSGSSFSMGRSIDRVPIAIPEQGRFQCVPLLLDGCGFSGVSPHTPCSHRPDVNEYGFATMKILSCAFSVPRVVPDAS